MRHSLHLWRDLTARHRSLQKRVEDVDNIRHMRYAFRHWQQAIEVKRKREAREGVRRRYSALMQTINKRILQQTFRVSSFLYSDFRSVCDS